jgi:hypothetical protein
MHSMYKGECIGATVLIVQAAHLGLIGSIASACPTDVTPPSYTSVVALCTPLTALPV